MRETNVKERLKKGQRKIKERPKMLKSRKAHWRKITYELLKER